MYDEDELSLSSDSEPCLTQDEQEDIRSGPGLKSERRQYHNLLERNRRNILKYSFGNLRAVVPTLAKKSSRQASRAKILRRAIEFIRRSELKRAARDKDIKDLKTQKRILEDQIRAMEAVTSSTDPNIVQALMREIDRTEFKEYAEEPSDSEEEDEDTSDEVENDCGSSEDEDSEIDVGEPESQVSWSISVAESDSETDDSSESEIVTD